jgi:hypothetical protein
MIVMGLRGHRRLRLVTAVNVSDIHKPSQAEK